MERAWDGDDDAVDAERQHFVERLDDRGVGREREGGDIGLIRADGTPKPALEHYARVADRMG